MGMERRGTGRSRDQHGGDHVTSSRETAECRHAGLSAEVSYPASKHARSQSLRCCIHKVPRKTRSRSGREFAVARSKERFQQLKSLKIKDTQKVSSQYIRDERGSILHDPELVPGSESAFSATFSTRILKRSDSTQLNGLSSYLPHTLSRLNLQKIR